MMTETFPIEGEIMNKKLQKKHTYENFTSKVGSMIQFYFKFFEKSARKLS